MDMEAAAPPRAKKTRWEAPETQDPENTARIRAAAAGEVPQFESTAKLGESRSQEHPPPEAGGDGGVDRISDLPDAVLGDIVSLLSTKEAARTQTLASRWRHVWRAAPLVLDCSDLTAKTLYASEKVLDAADEALARVVSLILSAHPGPGRRFCILPHLLHDWPATVDAWLRSPALDNLQELDFGDCQRNRPVVPARPPRSTFRFSATLRVATFNRCQLLDSSVEGLHFPHLKQLALKHVSILEASLHTMISSCPVLECLLLDNIFGFSCVQISSSSLRSICMGASHCGYELQLQEFIIVDAPCLERLLFSQQYMAIKINVSVMAAPKLETVGCLNDVHQPLGLVFGNTIIEGLRVINLMTVVHSVKILAVKSLHINLDMVINLLKCFPCVEKLYIKFCFSGGEMNRWRRKHRQFLKCFDIRLKRIVLVGYVGIRSQVNFASFFLLNASKLELMTLEVGNRADNEAFIAEQYGLLQMEKRASRSALLHFSANLCHSDLHMNHVRDLAITNPFECRCLGASKSFC